MDEQSGQTVRRLTEEHGSWFLRDDYLEKGRLSDRLHPFGRRFSPIRINGVTHENRIAMAPMGSRSRVRCGSGGVHSRPDAMRRHLSARLFMKVATAIDPRSPASVYAAARQGVMP